MAAEKAEKYGFVQRMAFKTDYVWLGTALTLMIVFIMPWSISFAFGTECANGCGEEFVKLAD